MPETIDFIKSTGVDSFLSYPEFVSVVNPYRSLNLSSKHVEVIDKYIEDHPIPAMAKIKNSVGDYLEGVCVWNNLQHVDRSISCLQKVDFSEKRVISFRHPINGSASTPSRELENIRIAESIGDVLQKKGLEYLLRKLPPLIGYQYRDTIVVTEGARRLAGLHHNKIPFTYIWLEEINSDGDCLNLNYYAQATKKDDLLRALEGYYNIPDYRVVPDYGFERKYFYPDLSKQVGALVKHTLGEDLEELVTINKEIHNVKSKIRKK